MQYRNVLKLITGIDQTDGAGVKLTRVLSNNTVTDFDPFLMLDVFDSTQPSDYIKGFPWHPHRGIETVTYIIQGDVEHGDSLGNSGRIGKEDCQWMTAGSGIIHQEMPQAVPRMLGIQLWVNLPRKKKMTVPHYRAIAASNIPVYENYAVAVNVISGECNGKKGAISGGVSDITLLDITLQANLEWICTTNEEQNVFVYVMEGSASFSNMKGYVSKGHAVLFDSGEEIYMKGSSDGCRMILFGGVPLKEPVAWGGPIVMNTKKELEKAFEELENRTFIKSNPIN